jgi:hypothetical protein
VKEKEALERVHKSDMGKRGSDREEGRKKKKPDKKR